MMRKILKTRVAQMMAYTYSNTLMTSIIVAVVIPIHNFSKKYLLIPIVSSTIQSL